MTVITCFHHFLSWLKSLCQQLFLCLLHLSIYPFTLSSSLLHLHLTPVFAVSHNFSKLTPLQSLSFIIVFTPLSLFYLSCRVERHNVWIKKRMDRGTDACNWFVESSGCCLTLSVMDRDIQFTPNTSWISINCRMEREEEEKLGQREGGERKWRNERDAIKTKKTKRDIREEKERECVWKDKEVDRGKKI